MTFRLCRRLTELSCADFPTAPTAGNVASASFSTSTPTSGSSPGSSSSSTNSGGDLGLNTGSLIGIIIAAVGTLATIVGAYFAWKAVQKKRDRGNRAMVQDGNGQYSGLRPQYGAPEVYGAPRQVYGAPPLYGGHVYPNGWR